MSSNKTGVICICHNNCVDRLLSAENLVLGCPNKVKFVSESPAGKSVNVANIFNQFNVPCVCVGYIGTDRESAFKEKLRRAQLKMISTSNRTRVNTTIIDSISLQETHIRELGDEVSETLYDEILSNVLKIGVENQWVVISGSFPPGISVQYFKSFVEKLRSKKLLVAVDTSGPFLRQALEGGASLIKPNRAEVQELVGKETVDSIGLLQSCVRLRAQYPGTELLVSDGPNGCFLIALDEVKHAVYNDSTNKIVVQSSVGAGDALLGGYIAGLYQGWDANSRLRFAIRVATATLPCGRVGEMDRDVLKRDPFNVLVEILREKEVEVNTDAQQGQEREKDDGKRVKDANAEMDD